MKPRILFLAAMAVCVVPVYVLVRNYEDSHAITSLANWHVVLITLGISAVVAAAVTAFAGLLLRPKAY